MLHGEYGHWVTGAYLPKARSLESACGTGRAGGRPAGACCAHLCQRRCHLCHRAKDWPAAHFAPVLQGRPLPQAVGHRPTACLPPCLPASLPACLSVLLCYRDGLCHRLWACLPAACLPACLPEGRHAWGLALAQRPAPSAADLPPQPSSCSVRREMLEPAGAASLTCHPNPAPLNFIKYIWPCMYPCG